MNNPFALLAEAEPNRKNNRKSEPKHAKPVEVLPDNAQSVVDVEDSEFKKQGRKQKPRKNQPKAIPPIMPQVHSRDKARAKRREYVEPAMDKFSLETSMFPNSVPSSAFEQPNLDLPLVFTIIEVILVLSRHLDFPTLKAFRRVSKSMNNFFFNNKPPASLASAFSITSANCVTKYTENDSRIDVLIVQLTVDTTLIPLDRVRLSYSNFSPVYTIERTAFLKQTKRNASIEHVRMEHPHLYAKFFPDGNPQHPKPATVFSNRQSVSNLINEQQYYIDKKGRRKLKKHPVNIDQMIAKNPDCEIVLNGASDCHSDYTAFEDIVDYFCCNECNIDVLSWASDNRPFIIGHELKPTTHCLAEDFANVNKKGFKGAVLFHHDVVDFDYMHLRDNTISEKEMLERTMAREDVSSDPVKKMTYYSHSGLLSEDSRYSISQRNTPKADLKPGRNYAFLSCSNCFGEIFSAPFFFEAQDEVYYYCLRGCGDVMLANGDLKRVDELAVGDRVRSVEKDGSFVETKVIARKVDRRIVAATPNLVPFSFVCIGKTWVTPGHPIRMDSKWLQPSDIGEVVEIEEETEVFNFVLANRSSLFVNGLEVATLGQFCDGIDKEDSFFGTERVVRHMRSLPGWPNVVC